MLFNTLSYAIFLPCVFVLYWILPHKLRCLLLLIASYYFYMSWNAKYVVLIATTTLVSYFCAILIDKTEKEVYKRTFIIVSLFVSLGILFLFKYYNFTLDIISHFTSVNVRYMNLLLPVGISFYTFQTLSYVIDVYRGNAEVEKNIVVYATYVSFFPQLVAGPIERTSNLIPQIRAEKHFDYDAAKYGIRLILWGLYKKMVIADNLAIWVDKVYGDVSSYTGFSFVLAAFFFSFQIYCDFSGYSDIARGSAKLLNIDLMENFKSPYFSASIKEFWSRWHISLSTWLRDYVYIPLGGNRVSKFRNLINYMITFLASGLWHGASLTYVVWGGIHGAGQVYEKSFEIEDCKRRDIYWAIRVVFVFAFVSLAWVFFRAGSINDAVYVLRNMHVGLSQTKAYFAQGFYALGMDKVTFLKILALYLIPLSVYDFFSLQNDVCAWVGERNIIVRYAYLIILIAVVLICGYMGQSTFVYFQF